MAFISPSQADNIAKSINSFKSKSAEAAARVAAGDTDLSDLNSISNSNSNSFPMDIFTALMTENAANRNFDSALSKFGDILSQNSANAASVTEASIDKMNAFNASEAQKSRDFSAQQAAEANAFTASENAKARDFNAAQNALNNAFNASEAQKSRDWQTDMSNTSYQRAVADLKNAGLNPILAVQGLTGASSGSNTSASSSGTASSPSGSGIAASSSTASSSGYNKYDKAELSQLLSSLMSTAISSSANSIEKNKNALEHADRLSSQRITQEANELQGTASIISSVSSLVSSFLPNVTIRS